MSSKTFKHFVLSRTPGDSLRGDFVRDFRVMPIEANRWSELWHGLKNLNASTEAIFTARRLWNEFARMKGLMSAHEEEKAQARDIEVGLPMRQRYLRSAVRS
jgi:hypothetical protein